MCLEARRVPRIELAILESLLLSLNTWSDPLGLFAGRSETSQGN